MAQLGAVLRTSPPRQRGALTFTPPSNICADASSPALSPASEPPSPLMPPPLLNRGGRDESQNPPESSLGKVKAAAGSCRRV